jgi:hypothetical protein
MRAPSAGPGAVRTHLVHRRRRLGLGLRQLLLYRLHHSGGARQLSAQALQLSGV